MYEMVKKIIGRSCGGSGGPALLPAGLSSHCCVLLPSSCCPGPLQGMGEEFGALPLRWHLPRAGQPDPSSEQVSWFWVLRRAGSSRVGSAQLQNASLELLCTTRLEPLAWERLGHSSGCACTRYRSVCQPWGWNLVQCHRCVVTCSVQEYLALVCLDLEHPLLHLLGVWCCPLFQPSHLALQTRTEQFP